VEAGLGVAVVRVSSASDRDLDCPKYNFGQNGHCRELVDEKESVDCGLVLVKEQLEPVAESSVYVSY
jgi:hypothetical protein